MNKYGVAGAAVALLAAGGLYYAFVRRPVPVDAPVRERAGEVSRSSGSPAAAREAASDRLKAEDIRTGTGGEAKIGTKATVHYVGTLTDGTQFDGSRDRGQPFSFTLGQGRVIPGWEQGILGMRVGGIRRLSIPPALAYGATGRPGAIPPNATLIFEVELLAAE